MQGVRWIKISTDIFDDEKIILIESMPEAYAIITVWFKLLCLAGKQNNSGVFMIGDRIAYTDEMLATIFRMKKPIVTLALHTFEKFGMVDIINDVITIPNWEKHQTLDAYEMKKERDRIYQAKRREKQKLIVDKSSDSKTIKSSDIDDNRFTDIDIDKEIEIDDKKECYKKDIDAILDRWNLSGFPKVIKLTSSTKRYQNVVARIKEYGIDAVMEMIEKATASDYMHGKNQYGWQADFGWCFLPNNFPKVLEGNYDNRKTGIDELIGEFLSRGER